MTQLVVLTGPSGVGKGTLKKVLLDQLDLAESISATTRDPREGETDGVEYHFLSRERFAVLQEEGAFLESAEFAGNLYGTLLSEVTERSDGSRAVVLEIETLGAQQVREKVPDAILVFIAPPDISELRKRLEGRGTDSNEHIERRLAEAEREIELASSFDCVIVNDDLAQAAAQLVAEVRSRLD